MKNKLFILLLLGIIAVSGTSFCGEEQQPSQSYAQQAKNWLWTKLGKPFTEDVLSSTTRGIAVATIPAVASMTKSWTGKTPSAEILSGLGLTATGVAFGGEGAVRYWSAVFSRDPIGVITGAAQLAMGLYTGFKGMNVGEGTNYDNANFIASTFAGAVITGLAINAFGAWNDLGAKGKASNEQVIENYTKVLRLAITDPAAFPTIESKIDAINEPENLGLNISPTNGLAYNAMNLVRNELEKNPLFTQIQNIKKILKNKLGKNLQTDELGNRFIYNTALQTAADKIKAENPKNTDAIQCLNQILIDAKVNQFKDTDEKNNRNTPDARLNAWDGNHQKAVISYINRLKKQIVAETNNE